MFSVYILVRIANCKCVCIYLSNKIESENIFWKHVCLFVSQNSDVCISYQPIPTKRCPQYPHLIYYVTLQSVCLLWRIGFSENSHTILLKLGIRNFFEDLPYAQGFFKNIPWLQMLLTIEMEGRRQKWLQPSVQQNIIFMI